MRLRPRHAAVLAALVLAQDLRAGAGTQFALGWPPTRYRSAELILWLDDVAQPVTIRIHGRGVDSTLSIEGSAAVRVPLPPEAQCAVGIDACVLFAERVAGAGRFVAAFQSPDTAGAADTLLLTAHDSVLLPPREAAATAHVVLAAPNPATSAFAESASFATIVPVAWPARVRTSGGCAVARDVALSDGEALTIACAAAGEDVTGILVDSDVSAVVLSGNVVTQVPWDGGSGLSGDLVLDSSPAARLGPTTLVAPPLPRSAATAGRGDIVRVVALAPSAVTVTDGAGAAITRLLAAGAAWDIDSLGPVADRMLRIDADGPVAAWHLLKSRMLRGVGDPAAIPLVARHAFTRRARFFVPDGYAEACTLVVVAEPGAAVLLDGIALSGWTSVPGGGLDAAIVALPAPAAGSGTVHSLAGDAPFGAWIAGLGGYKAHGMAAAIDWPATPAPGVDVLRGVMPAALEVVARVAGGSWRDAGSEPLVYYAIDDPAALLEVARCSGQTCLSW